jgi:hypothetical protein
MLFLTGCALAEDAAIARKSVAEPAESAASVSIVRESGMATSATEAVENLSFTGFARQGPNMITNKWDPQEIQLFITDTNECGGSGAPTRQINFDIYASSLPDGAVPGKYTITNVVDSTTPPTWSTWSLSGFGDLTIQSGTVTLTQVSSSLASGSFTARLLSGDGTIYDLEGSFLAPFCAGNG